MSAHVTINEKGAQRVLRRHPWVFRSDVVQAASGLKPGDIVSVQIKKGKFLGQAFYNAHSLITLRFISHSDEKVDASFWAKRFSDSIARRQHLPWPDELFDPKVDLRFLLKKEPCRRFRIEAFDRSYLRWS